MKNKALGTETMLGGFRHYCDSSSFIGNADRRVFNCVDFRWQG